MLPESFQPFPGPVIVLYLQLVPRGNTDTINLVGPSTEQVYRKELQREGEGQGRELPVAISALSAVQLKGDLSCKRVPSHGTCIHVRRRKINSF